MTYRIERTNANKAGSLKRSTKLANLQPEKKRRLKTYNETTEIKSVVLTDIQINGKESRNKLRYQWSIKF